MKVLTPGHKYLLDNFEDSDTPPQTIQFIEKGKRGEAPFPMQAEANPDDFITYNDGTTNEEVLAVLIDRISFLNEKFPCAENLFAISSLKGALHWLEERTKNRKNRGVEGKYEA